MGRTKYGTYRTQNGEQRIKMNVILQRSFIVAKEREIGADIQHPESYNRKKEVEGYVVQHK